MRLAPPKNIPGRNLWVFDPGNLIIEFARLFQRGDGAARQSFRLLASDIIPQALEELGIETVVKLVFGDVPGFSHGCEMNAPHWEDIDIRAAIVLRPDGIVHRHDAAGEFWAREPCNRLVVVVVAAEAVQEFLLGLPPVSGQAGGGGVVEQLSHDDVEVARWAHEDHATVDTAPVVTVPELIRRPRNSDIFGHLLENFVEVGDNKGVSVQDEDSFIKVNSP